MHDHTFVSEPIATKKSTTYVLYGYPKRYKTHRWTYLTAEHSIAYLLEMIKNTRRYKEPYNFKIAKLTVTSEFTPVSMEQLMLEKIKHEI
jgi:hypothetical protein